MNAFLIHKMINWTYLSIKQSPEKSESSTVLFAISKDCSTLLLVSCNSIESLLNSKQAKSIFIEIVPIEAHHQPSPAELHHPGNCIIRRKEGGGPLWSRKPSCTSASTLFQKSNSCLENSILTKLPKLEDIVEHFILTNKNIWILTPRLNLQTIEKIQF